ncbi:hypothetical protein GBAR_LOCUS11237, partial [Geodia barretti]
MSEKERYESLCREPWPLPKEYDSELTCFYYDNHRTPSLVIRPMKVEVVFPQTSYIHTAVSLSLSPSLLLRLSIFSSLTFVLCHWRAEASQPSFCNGKYFFLV